MSSVHPQRGLIVRTVSNIIHALVAAVGRLDKSLSPAVTIQRLRAHKFTVGDSIYLFHIALAAFWITLMQEPAYPYKLAIPIVALLIPFASQYLVYPPSHRLPSRNTSLPSIRLYPNILPHPSYHSGPHPLVRLPSASHNLPSGGCPLSRRLLWRPPQPQRHQPPTLPFSPSTTTHSSNVDPSCSTHVSVFHFRTRPRRSKARDPITSVQPRSST